MDIEILALTSGISGFVLGMAILILYQKRAAASPEILGRAVLEDLGLFGEQKQVTHIFTKNTKKRSEMASLLEMDAKRNMESAEKRIEEAQEVIDSELGNITRIEAKISKMDTKGKQSTLVQSQMPVPLKKIETSMRLLSAEMNSYSSAVNLMLFWNAVKQGKTRRKTVDDLIEKSGMTADFDTKIDKMLTATTKTLQMSQSSQDRIMETWIEKLE